MLEYEGLDLILKRDAKTFNAWRIKYIDTRLDFSGFPLDHFWLADLYLINMNFDNVDFTSSHLHSTIFCGSSLRNCKFEYSTLIRSEFGIANKELLEKFPQNCHTYLLKPADISGASFYRTLLHYSNFRSVKMDFALFDWLGLDECDFSGSNHKAAIFHDVTTWKTKF